MERDITKNKGNDWKPMHTSKGCLEETDRASQQKKAGELQMQEKVGATKPIYKKL